MTGREKIEAALSGEGTPEIPAVICYEDLYVRDHWDELTSCPWWYPREPSIQRQLAWRREAIARTGQDWYDHPRGCSALDRQNLTVEERSEGVFLVDRRTDHEEKLQQPRIAGWKIDEGVQSHHPKRLAETPDEIDALIPWYPDPAGISSDGRAALAAEMLREFGSDRYPIYLEVTSPFTELYDVWGFEGMMEMVADRPDLVHYATGKLLENAVRETREAAALGSAGIWLEECFTDVISPEAFRLLNRPYLGALIEEARGLGLATFYYYCGDPAHKWDLLLSVGADAIALEESKKGFTIDVEHVVDIVQGRCTVLGNLDAIDLLPNGSEEQLRAEIARQIAAGRRNRSRFIMSLGSPVTPGTSVERVRLYCDLVHELGKS